MKVKVLNINASTPFADLKIGEAWITTQAELSLVNTIHIKVSDTEYTELRGDSPVWTVDKDTEMVRRVKIVSVEVELA